ncbi:MAG: MOP flippase family protein [Chitinophagaceae bacterium]
MKESLKHAAIGGVKWTSLSSIVGVLGQLIQMAILARLLDSNDFGLMGIAVVVISFSTIFLDMGMTNVIVQRNDITRNEMDSLFWFNVLTGAVLFLLIYILAPVIADFYKEVELAAIIRWIACSFLIVPFEIQFLALLQKELDFRSIAQRDLISRLTGLAAGIIAAYYGMGVYALIILHLSTIAVATLCIIPLGWKRYRPGVHFNPRELKRFMKFGSFVMGDSLINFFNRSIDNLLIGKWLGMGSLGTYNLAKNFSMRPYMIINPIITQVTFPLLAKCKDDAQLSRGIYKKTINYLSALNFPVYMFIALFSEEVVAILYGGKWLEIVPVLRMLALGFMVRSVFNPMGALFISKGKPQLSFYWNLSLIFLIPAVIYLSVPYGIFSVAAAQFVLMVLLLIPAWKFLLFPVLEIPLQEYLVQIWIPLKTTIVALILPAGLKWFGITGSAIVNIATGGLLFFVGYLLAVRSLNVEIWVLMMEQPKVKKITGLLRKTKLSK